MGLREDKSNKYYSERMVPTLDGDGWIKFNNKEKLDRLLSDFFVSDAAQSTLYRKMMATYQSISARDIGSLTLLRDTLEDYLRVYLNKYVPETEVNVYTTDLAGTPKDLFELDSEAAVGLRLEISYLENNMFKEYKKDITYQKGVFAYVLDKFNTGT